MRARNGIGIGLIAAVLTGLALHPATGWVARVQLQSAAGLTPAIFRHWEKGDRTPEKTVAAQHPQEVAFQFAEAVSVSERRTRLRELIVQFPENPALRAAALRFDTQGAIKPLHRDDEYLLSTTKPKNATPEKPLDPKDAAAFEADAEAGERLDPDNAYFPLMRAIGLYGVGKDDQARAAVHRAAQKAHYNDYVREEAEAHWALSDAAYGNSGTIVKVAQSAAILFPHYASLRSVARITLTEALRQELRGENERALGLRQDLRRVGGLMRRDATSTIGNLVGAAIVAISAGKPGGAEVTGLKTLEGKERAAASLAAYRAHCQKIGHPEEAEAFAQELARGEQARNINLWASMKGVGIFDLERLAKLGIWWLTGSVVLASLSFTLILGAVTKGLARTGRIREGKPLHAGVRLGLWFFLGNGVLSTLAVATLKVLPTLSAICWLGGVVTTLTCLWILIWGTPPTQRRTTLLVGMATVIALAALLAVALLPLWSSARLWWGLLQGLGISTSSEGGAPSAPGSLVAQALQRFALGLVPCVAVIGLALSGWRQRVPASVAIVRGFSHLAVPLAFLIACVYGGVVAKTMRDEASYQKELHAMIQHEGRYNAHLMKVAWPTP